jgi:stage II sporulation protein D
VFAVLKTKEIVNVGILLEVESLNIASDKKYSIRNSDKILNLSPGKINIKILGDKIIIGKYNLILPVKIESDSYLLVNKNLYRGNIIIRLSKNRNLNIINELSIEDYLKGVLPKEVNPSWDIEALKAQAVISRSYVIKNLQRHSCDDFNVCSTVHCQVYGGASVENEKCNKAIADTEGQVVIFKDEIAQTVFHASCGGYTEDPKYVWVWKQETPDYLKGRKDKYCSESPHNKWSCTLSEVTIRKRLINAGYNIGEIKNISLSGNTSGHAKEFVIIKHNTGKLKLNAYKFRLAVDSNLIKSAMIKNINKKGINFIFTGKGWGHRIGLCQCGAKVMAEKGFSYKDILKYYYPKTKIESIEYDK